MTTAGLASDSHRFAFVWRQFGLLVAALVGLQGILWIGAPLLLEGSVRLDVAEGAIDGPEWRLSYFRHPPLSTWLSGLAWHAGPLRYAAVYAIGWALASGAIAIVALFLSRVDRREAGLVALVAGLTSPFATYAPIQVNHNITLMTFWAATLAAGWFAFEGGALVEWAIFGAAVGLGVWAKYSILHLVVPLAAAFLLTPRWRVRLWGPGPWLALAIFAAVVAPHFADAIAMGATTLKFAAGPTPSTLLARLGWIGEFVGDCLAINVVPAAIAALASGPARLVAALRTMASPRGARLDRYLLAASLGPIALVAAGALLGRQPHYLWATAFSVSFVAFWGRAASLAAGSEVAGFSLRRLALGYVALALLTVLGYAAVIEFGSRLPGRPRYPDMDGPALAALASDIWAAEETGPIPYLVSYGDDRTWPAMQAAGSIVFDLPYRVRTIVEADPAMSTWIDVADLRRRGALVVSVKPLQEGDRMLGIALTHVVELQRPMLRGSRSEPIVFAILPPGS